MLPPNSEQDSLVKHYVREHRLSVIGQIIGYGLPALILGYICWDLLFGLGAIGSSHRGYTIIDRRHASTARD